MNKACHERIEANTEKKKETFAFDNLQRIFQNKEATSRTSMIVSEEISRNLSK